MSTWSSSIRGFAATRELSFWLSYRRLLILLCHIVLVAFSYYASFLLRFDFAITPRFVSVLWLTLPIVLAIKLLIFYSFSLYHGWWRYVGVSDLLDILKASTASTVLIFFLIMVLFPAPYPRAVLVMDYALTILVVGGARFVVRMYTESMRSYLGRKRTLVVGAGAAGQGIVREIRINPELDLNPAGFVDDDPSKRNLRLQGLKVLGDSSELPQIIAREKIECVLIAIPSAHSSAVQRIVKQCQQSRVALRILPPIAERINGRPEKLAVRGVKVEDLLGRAPVVLDVAHIRERFQDRVVMITGAGGSIGSELVRQLVRFNPLKLIVFDRSENDLHKISIELSANSPELRHVPIVGDILDVRLLREVVGEYRPHSIFHAAAYKHVPMMESNCFQAVRNNVFGTYNVALVAEQYNVQDFVLISSDKAVNPTNIMGVTKRIAELVILSLQNHKHTRFVAVRFGNVLGSNGSVLQLFEQQIARGGPVTVTHEEARRYFMTIPEAAQLVLQAAVMGKGGEIFVLDMGEPIKIVDLARSLIRLSGHERDQDIKIAFTGLRPGEKLFEELHLEGEGVKATTHQKIRVLDGGSWDFRELLEHLDDLSSLVERSNVYGLVLKIKAIVPEYRPSENIRALCEIDRHDMLMDYKLARKTLTVVDEGVA